MTHWFYVVCSRGNFPFIVSSMTMTAVGDAAFDMIKELEGSLKKSQVY